MKKLLIAACMFLSLGTLVSAQQVKKAPAAKVAPAAVAAKKTAAPVKADGTPDKRFKANKAAPAVATVPLKKDGTPDKRFKAKKKI